MDSLEGNNMHASRTLQVIGQSCAGLDPFATAYNDGSHDQMTEKNKRSDTFMPRKNKKQF